MHALRRTAPFALPTRILQFGQGNFMRGFFDWQIDLLNERANLDAGVVIVRPRGGRGEALLDVQDGLFTTLVRGIDEAGREVKQYRKITCVQREIDIASMYGDYLEQAKNPDLRLITSNTTEAGIAVNDSDRYEDAPPSSFPAKLARLLHERFRHFAGARDKGVVVLPCELIDDNGAALRAALLHFARLWQLEDAFTAWLNEACTFCSTLVDRIVTGYPAGEEARIAAELGYEDRFLVAAEYFYLFVIEGPAWLADELKLAGADLNIHLVDEIAPYKKRKVGILNGGHTALVPVALMAGLETVGEALADEQVSAFLREALYGEIIPALAMERADLEAFAADVLRRFRNPFIRHRLDAIALNSWPKFAVRVMPQLLRHAEIHGAPPKRLTLALAATMALYRGERIQLSDDVANLAWFRDAWERHAAGGLSLAELTRGWLANDALWERDLNAVPGLTEATTRALQAIQAHGMRAALKAI